MRGYSVVDVHFHMHVIPCRSQYASSYPLVANQVTHLVSMDRLLGAPPPADLQSGPDTPRWLPKCMLVQEAMKIVQKNTKNCARNHEKLCHI